MDFELKNEGYNSSEEEKSSVSDDEVEPQTLSLRRSIYLRRPLVGRCNPPDFCYAFILSAINDEPRSVREVLNFEKGKLWKKGMVEEIEALDKN